jgi:hypothetical protein
MIRHRPRIWTSTVKHPSIAVSRMAANLAFTLTKIATPDNTKQTPVKYPQNTCERRQSRALRKPFGQRLLKQVFSPQADHAHSHHTQSINPLPNPHRRSLGDHMFSLNTSRPRPTVRPYYFPRRIIVIAKLNPPYP